MWDVNVAGMSGDGQESYYLQDELGSPIRLMDKDGDLEESYGYDEFGQGLYGNQGIVQPFGYTGYQPDRIAGTYYAQAREYRTELGRFAVVDPIKKGLNWYAYCRNNSLKYFDPLGSEKIVVSGGVYSEDKLEDDAYYYEFVDAAIAQIIEWNSLDSNESIMWIIADNGWTELNKKELMKAAKSLGVDIQFITDKSELIEYINNKDGDISERAEDKISDISVFSHGINLDGGVISLGFNYGERKYIYIAAGVNRNPSGTRRAYIIYFNVAKSNYETFNNTLTVFRWSNSANLY